MTHPARSRSVRRRLTVRAVESRPSPSPSPSPSTSPSRSPEPRRPARWWRLAAAVLGVLLVAALAGVGLLARDLHDRRQIETAHRQALAAARQAAVDFLSISAATVDQDIERITGTATGDFREEFVRSAAQVRAAVTENKVDSRGSVLRTGLVSGDTRAAVVLVAVDATVKNKGAPKGRLSHYRIRVGLTHDEPGDRWLINQLQFVG